MALQSNLLVVSLIFALSKRIGSGEILEVTKYVIFNFHPTSAGGEEQFVELAILGSEIVLYREPCEKVLLKIQLKG